MRQNRPAAKRKKANNKTKLPFKFKEALIHKAPWKCPVCDKQHSKLHYPFADQLDAKKKPDEVGRVKYGREDKYDCDSFKEKGKPITGPAIDKDGNPNSLFCPHCGWIEEIILIVKTK